MKKRKYSYRKDVKSKKSFTSEIKKQLKNNKIKIKSFNEHKFRKSIFNTKTKEKYNINNNSDFITERKSNLKSKNFEIKKDFKNLKRVKYKKENFKVSKNLRSLDLKQKILRRNLRNRSIKKNIKKSNRKRYIFFGKMWKGVGDVADFTKGFLRTGKNDETGIETAYFFTDKVSKIAHYKSRKNFKKPKKFSKKAFFKQQKNDKLNKRISYKSKLQTNERKIKYKQEKNILKKYLQKRRIKKEYNYHLVGRLKEFFKETGKKIASSIAKVALPIIFLLFLFFTVTNSIFSVFQNTTSNVVAKTSYLSEKDILIKIENYYKEKETELLNEIYDPHKYHKGYDDISVEYDEIGHNIHNLLSYVTSSFGEVEDFEKFKSKLDNLFDLQYTKELKEETYIVEKVDEKGKKYKEKAKRLIIKVKSTNLDELAREILKDTENLEHYEILLETKGNFEEEFAELENNTNFSNVTILGNYGFNVSDGKFPEPDPKHRAKINGGYAGQCTWYVYNRLSQLGVPIPYWKMGHGGQWGFYAAKYGYPVGKTAKAGMAMSFPITNSAPYGHIAFVEKVNADGSVVVSEMNVKGEFIINYRTISKERASSCLFIDFGL